MRFYRFELTLDGEMQDVGLFQGLQDALPDTATALLDTLFATLPVPVVDEDTSCEPLCCWFTESGLARYMSELQTLVQHVHEAGWGVCAAVIDEDESGPVYADEVQVVFTVEYLQKCYELVEIERIEDAKELLPSN